MNGLPTFTRSLRDQIRHPIPVPDFDFLKSGSYFAELPTKTEREETANLRS